MCVITMAAVSSFSPPLQLLTPWCVYERANLQVLAKSIFRCKEWQIVLPKLKSKPRNEPI